MFLKHQPALVLLFGVMLYAQSWLPCSACGDDVASRFNSQGIKSYRAGKLEEAETLFRDALKELDMNNGSDQMRATVLNNLSFVLRKQGRDDEAKAAEEKADNLKNPVRRSEKGTTNDAHSTGTPASSTHPAPNKTKLPSRPISGGRPAASPVESAGEASNSSSTLDKTEETLLRFGSQCQTAGDINGALSAYKEFLRLFPHSESAQKVRNLVKALEEESEHMYPGHGSIASASFNPASNPDEDYYAEMIRGGVHRWPSSKMPLKVHITSGTGVQGYRPAFESILSECFEDWSTASVGRIQFVFVPTADDCDIDCNWTDAATSLNGPAEQGEAETSYDHKGISSSKIHLLTLRPSSGLELTDNQMRTVCLHEIGHALGLLRHTANPADVMFFTSSPKDERKELSSRDRNTIIKLYSTTSDNQ